MNTLVRSLVKKSTGLDPDSFPTYKGNKLRRDVQFEGCEGDENSRYYRVVTEVPVKTIIRCNEKINNECVNHTLLHRSPFSEWCHKIRI